MRHRISTQKALTTIAAIGASAALLVGCGTDNAANNDTGDGGAPAGNSSSGDNQKHSNKTEDELKAMLLTDEVNGYNFKGDVASSDVAHLASPMLDATKVEPADCQKLLDVTKQIAEFTVTMTENKSENVFAATGLYTNAEIYDTMAKSMEGCEEYTITSDSAGSAEKLLGDQDVPPEVIAELEKFDSKTTTHMTVHKLDLPVEAQLDKVYAVEYTGTSEIAGSDYVYDEFRIVGVVDGLVVTSSTQPYGNFGVDENGKVVGTTDGRVISPEAKEEAKKRLVEIFNAQVKKVRDS